jgi:hypothetical protein
MQSAYGSPALHLSPRGRGLFAMTYGCVANANSLLDRKGAAVSRSANRVRGNFALNTPSSAPSGHLLPKGRRATHRR